MKRVRVEIPFKLISEGKNLSHGNIITITDDVLEKIRAVNINMVSVLEDVQEPEPEGEQEPEPEGEQEPEPEKKTRSRKK